MSNIFEQSIIVNKEKLNTFPLTHTKTLTCNMGYLVPIMALPVVPDDRIKFSHSVKVKFAPLVAPIMDEIDVVIHSFFCPYRVLWAGSQRDDDWKTFISGGKDGKKNPIFPRIEVTPAIYNSSMGKSTLSDYLNIHSDNANFQKTWYVSAMPYRMYQTVYNNYYINLNLQDEVQFTLDGGIITDNALQVPDKTYTKKHLTDGLLQIRRINWKKDYFTSSLPWAQRGQSVVFPLSGQADLVTSTGYSVAFPTISSKPQNTQANKDVIARFSHSSDTNYYYNLSIQDEDLQYSDLRIDPFALSNIKADLSTASSITVESLRRMFQLQRFLEINAIGGSRYNEVIYSHWGVKIPDDRLSKPIYLGGKSIPVQVSEVLQTSQSSETSPQGNQTGLANGYGSSGFEQLYSVEHGILMSIMCIRPYPKYKTGLPREWQKWDKLDFYWPDFANLGEQSIYNKELYFDPDGNPDGTFGYQSRYSEYKYIPSTVHGDFRDTLEYWTLVRDFSSQPNLNSDFVECTPSDRIFAVQDAFGDNLRVEVLNEVYATRAMPVFATPHTV